MNPLCTWIIHLVAVLGVIQGVTDKYHWYSTITQLPILSSFNITSLTKFV